MSYLSIFAGDEKALKKEIKIMMKKTVVQKEPDKLPAKRISKRKKNFSSSDEEENKEQHLLAKKKPKKSVVSPLTIFFMIII